MKKSIGAKTIVFPTPVFIVGSYNKDGRPNAMSAAWGGISCSEPPCVSVSIRKHRKSNENIMHRKAFTVNIPSEKYMKEADYLGIYSGKTHDKFKETGLTAVKAEFVDAPAIGEFPLVLECQLYKTLELGSHTVFVGEIKDVKVDEQMMTEGGMPDIGKIKPFSFNPADIRYYATGAVLAAAFSIGKKS